MRKAGYYTNSFLNKVSKAVRKGVYASPVVASIGRENTPSHKLFIVDDVGAYELKVVRCRDSRDVARLQKKI